MDHRTTEAPEQRTVTPAPHAPLPWTASDLASGLVDDLGKGIAICNSTDGAFIVRAVNSHHALVASLAEMMGVYWGAGDGELPEPECIIRARKALYGAGVTVQWGDNVSGEVNQ